MMSNVRVITLSPPGAGKGTHCARLSAATGVAHVSSGEVLRQQIVSGSASGRRAGEYVARGDLVPDDVIFEVLVPVVIDAVRTGGGYLLDGFPRTMAQALRAAEIGDELDLSSDAVVYLTAPEGVLVERLLDRAVREGRADDRPSVIRHRLAVFDEQTRPLVDYYRSRGILHEVDANRPEERVQADLRTLLGVEAP